MVRLSRLPDLPLPLPPWKSHPYVRSGDQLTLGERTADRVRNGMGSWTFVICALVFLAAWMAFNGRQGFDPYPFILLNLVLSCLAAMQGAILLIAAKRSDQVASELAESDYHADTFTRDAVTSLAAKVEEVARQHDGTEDLLREILRRLDRIDQKQR